MQMDKKWAIRLAWMIGGMCAGVLMAENDETLTQMMEMCPECDCQQAETMEAETEAETVQAETETEAETVEAEPETEAETVEAETE